MCEPAVVHPRRTNVGLDCVEESVGPGAAPSALEEGPQDFIKLGPPVIRLLVFSSCTRDLGVPLEALKLPERIRVGVSNAAPLELSSDVRDVLKQVLAIWLSSQNARGERATAPQSSGSFTRSSARFPGSGQGERPTFRIDVSSRFCAGWQVLSRSRR